MTRELHFADLKGTLETFIKRLYGEDSVVRFRPHHFPLQSLLPKWTCNALVAMVKDAVYAKMKDGLKFWAAAWYIQKY